METKIALAKPSDLQEVVELLNASDLPEAGLRCSPGTLILTARDVDRLVGCAALEVSGEGALLRSVAVAADRRGAGLGDRLVDAALDLACNLHIVEVYLLTEGSEGFFARHGFQPYDRSRVPSAVAGSPGFTACRCADATCMAKRLEAHRGRRNRSALALSLHDLAPTDRPEPARCV